ncbi:MurR/RpiR family transcriptional regulator [Paraburkholderia bannensis]|uniref:MurR/RpiR family transcriptional regulator n=1 Tax=Paraburkholderia bannensis TaxID=765414 RepID=UPI002AC3330E|nr:MurR/RpiR family transcriptional regulator [Paraburkholderia bannensis]
MINTADVAPDSVERFLTQIDRAYVNLSGRHKIIARHLVATSGQIAFEDIHSFASGCDTHPSTVVRFAKLFGFSGFVEMRRLFRGGAWGQAANRFEHTNHVPGPKETCLQCRGQGGDLVLEEPALPAQVVPASMGCEALHNAVGLLIDARTIWIAGFRNSFAVSVHLDYSLRFTNRPIQLISGLGHLYELETRSIGTGDTLVAISLDHFPRELGVVARIARQNGANMILITDADDSSAVSADVTLLLGSVNRPGDSSVIKAISLVESLVSMYSHRLNRESSSAF